MLNDPVGDPSTVIALINGCHGNAYLIPNHPLPIDMVRFNQSPSLFHASYPFQEGCQLADKLAGKGANEDNPLLNLSPFLFVQLFWLIC